MDDFGNLSASERLESVVYEVLHLLESLMVDAFKANNTALLVIFRSAATNLRFFISIADMVEDDDDMDGVVEFEQFTQHLQDTNDMTEALVKSIGHIMDFSEYTENENVH